MSLLQQYRSYIRQHDLFKTKDRLLLAVSGGVDSVVLCELCKQDAYDFAIAHCNFGLRGEESDRDEQFVIALAKHYGVEIFVKHFDTAAIAKAEKRSIEETARQLRYTWFHELINGTGQPFAYILTAHHADDNIETLLMNIFRGTGIRGLHGILPKQGRLVRPLLFARRTDIERFAKEKALEFVTDHTNDENIYTRNFFRNTVIPLVSERYPEAGENILKNIRRFSEAELLYDQAIGRYKKELLNIKGNEVHIPVLKLAKAKPIATIIYEIIREFGFTANQTEEVAGLLASETGKYVKSATHRIIRNRKWLIISPNQTVDAAHIIIEETDVRVQFELGILHFKNLQPSTLNPQLPANIAQLDASLIQYPLLLRKWKAGDYFYPLGMKKKKKLGRFFNDHKLSLTQREKVWVIESGSRIIWVVGMRIDERFKLTGSTTTILELGLIPA